MEIFTLLETLEDILEKSKNVPFTDKCIVEKNEILDIIKEIRLNLPDELKQAKWIKEERERIIAEAQITKGTTTYVDSILADIESNMKNLSSTLINVESSVKTALETIQNNRKELK